AGFFLFQAADGIRDFHVTGVQTCALPIFPVTVANALPAPLIVLTGESAPTTRIQELTAVGISVLCLPGSTLDGNALIMALVRERSEERRVGKECGSRRAGGCDARSRGGRA